MDPWLSQRYAGVTRPSRTRTSSVRARTPSRRARRDADRLLDDLDRELRVRRARRRATWLAVVIVVGAAATVALHALELV